MTNRIKTVRSPRLILICCKNAERLIQIVSDILNYCKYNTCIEDFSENTDFILTSKSSLPQLPQGVVKHTVVFDEYSGIKRADVEGYKNGVTSYENADRLFGGDEGIVTTYSRDNYSADVTCRNISKNGDGTTSFDIINDGILLRVQIDDSKYMVDEVLQCMAVFAATGVPLAAAVEYFRD